MAVTYQQTKQEFDQIIEQIQRYSVDTQLNWKDRQKLKDIYTKARSLLLYIDLLESYAENAKMLPFYEEVFVKGAELLKNPTDSNREQFKALAEEYAVHHPTTAGRVLAATMLALLSVVMLGLEVLLIAATAHLAPITQLTVCALGGGLSIGVASGALWRGVEFFKGAPKSPVKQIEKLADETEEYAPLTAVTLQIPASRP